MLRRHIALVGMMGCGKSTVARQLGFYLSRPVVDLDKVISSQAGMTIREIFEKEGEAGFRQREQQCLEELVLEPTTTVIATGGGAIVQPMTRRILLSTCIVVYLKADVATLTARVGTAHGRPLLEGKRDISGEIARLLTERSFYYEMADIVLSVEGLQPAAVAEDLAELLLQWAVK